jgi:Na+/H+-dicarboxylate symporter
MDPRTNRMILIGIIIGIFVGGFLGWALGEKMLVVKWIGDFFLGALKMLIVPLIVSSMIVGISGLGDIRRVGLVGRRTLLYYMATTGISVLIGIIVVNIIRPGVGVGVMGVEAPARVAAKEAIGIPDIILSLISNNVVASAADPGLGQILPLITFSLIFGAVLTTLGKKGELVISFFDGVNEAIMKMIHLVMFLAPIGVFALIASRLGQAGGGEAFWGELLKIGKYALTVIIGLSIHALIVLPLLLRAFGRRAPARYAAGMAPALTTAFSTASSSATLPITMESAERNNKVSRRTATFVLPIGATINMDGTALYESVAAIFIAQAMGYDLSVFQQVLIFITATLASIGAAGIPEAGLVTMVIVLKAVGLPLDGIGLILAIDWFLDRCRTTVNVWGDAVGAAVIDRVTDSGEESRTA